jgi:hypothetical protein
VDQRPTANLIWIKAGCGKLAQKGFDLDQTGHRTVVKKSGRELLEGDR